jgi:hypothetical protein
LNAFLGRLLFFLKGDFLATNLFEFEGFGTALEVGHVPTL